VLALGPQTSPPKEHDLDDEPARDHDAVIIRATSAGGWDVKGKTSIRGAKPFDVKVFLVRWKTEHFQ
jgi:hypothetical protein